MESINILLLAANPVGTSQLRLDEEIRTIQAHIDGSGQRHPLHFVAALAVRTNDVLRLLNHHRPMIVHFCGHGDSSGEIILLENDGTPKSLSLDALTSLFAAFADTVRLVVLNACNSKQQAQALAKVIDYTIGFSSQLEDNVARDFSGAFYQALAYGRPIQQAFEQGLVRLRMDRIDPVNFPELFVRNSMNSYRAPVAQAAASPQPFTSLTRESSLPDGTSEQPIIIEIKISENIENFNAERSAALLQVIGAVLKWNGEVKIVGVRPGSTIVSLQLPYDKAQQLLELIEQGELQPYGILEASLLIPSVSTPSTDPEVHPEPLLLTPREQEIVRLVAHGHSTRAIAESLGLSQYTVNTYVRRIFNKLDVSSRAEMVAIVRHTGSRIATSMPETYSESLQGFNELFQHRFASESEIGPPKNLDQETSVQLPGRHIPQPAQQSRPLGAYETEHDFLTALQEGNEAAWALFTNEWGQRLFDYLKFSLPTTSDAEDVLSETLLALVSAFRTFDGKVTLATLCYSIAYRKVADYWRRPRNTSDSSEWVEFDSTNRADISPSEVLARLPPQSQQALLLRYYVGLSIAEIAQIFGRSYKATESLLRRARTQFERELMRITPP